MRGGKPPEGYKLFIRYTNVTFHGHAKRKYYYALVHGKVTVLLGAKMGEILSIVIGARGFPVPSTEIAKTLYGHDEDEARRWQKATIHVHINHLRRRLKSHGIGIDLRCTEGKIGYRFLGFRECDIVPEVRRIKKTPKEARYDPSRRDSVDKTNPMMKRNRRFPKRENPTQYESVEDVPWSFPVRHINHESRKWDWNWNDYVKEQNTKRD